jgi:hypothetical protein
LGFGDRDEDAKIVPRGEAVSLFEFVAMPHVQA